MQSVANSRTFSIRTLVSQERHNCAERARWHSARITCMARYQRTPSPPVQASALGNSGIQEEAATCQRHSVLEDLNRGTVILYMLYHTPLLASLPSSLIWTSSMRSECCGSITCNTRWNWTMHSDKCQQRYLSIRQR